MKNYFFSACRWTLISAFAATTGCGLLIGNTKPVSEKSDHYHVEDLSQINPDWQRLQSDRATLARDEDSEASLSDVAYRSNQTHSVIALDSACRPRNELASPDLKGFVDQLLMGITEIESRTDEETDAAHIPAHQVTVTGKINGERRKLRAVVLRQGRCVYDLMYISVPEMFSKQEEEFKTFVSSLRLD